MIPEAPRRRGDPIRWPDPDDGAWQIVFEWAAVSGRWEVVDMRISSLDPEITGSLNTSTLRGIPLGSLIEAQRRDLRADVERVVEAIRREPGLHISAETARQAADTAGVGSRRGRKGYPPAHWAEVARVYAAAYAQGDPPTVAVAEYFKVKKPTAAKWVSRARDAGFLSRKPGRGRAGGIGPMIESEEQ